MDEIKLLAVGNSFSEDALYYLHDVAKADGIELKVVNLYIGGCSLERHWSNVLTESKDYLYEAKGQSTERYVSVNEVLKEEKWNYIITQQASHDSGIEESYFPYLNQLLDYFKSNCPEAEYLLHKTWAYEIDSNHSEFGRYHCSQQEMYEKLSKCYDMASEKTGMRLIPSADVIQRVRKKAPFRYELGEKSLCRDGYHMDMIYGRYLLAGVIYTFLFGRDIKKNSFVPKGADIETLNVIKQCIYEEFKCDSVN
ncbi:DUF4886 domain-containing protein [Clostridium sp. Marseille-P299]|uniref:DUF4886 domain-containing protein n=1 Tax=Clostridium sp. Marseille-P299 TaxID=1805477 RepID=UPI0008341676|nr:DUF4886 domain-containing protein [Clostridium sp. Marseille-P299]